MRSTELNALIRNRRSVFPDQFDAGRAVDDDIIREILINATWAPNHGKCEPWHFTVFSGNGRQKFATLQSELYKKNAGENFKEGTYLKLQQNPLKASHIIAIGLKRSSNKKIPLHEDIAAVACAVQNIYLSVTAYGLGGYWTTGGITYQVEAKASFDLNEEDLLLGFFYIGHVSIPSAGANRTPIEKKSTWISE